MVEATSKHGRVHNAEGAREAILNAAETVFSEHGFDGARIDSIANASSYNSGLIFHYFSDKLSLYAEVIKRADREMSVLQARTLAPLLGNKINYSTPARFRALLKQIVATNFDYLVEHPRFTRILIWEQAAGWQTFSMIYSQFETDYSDQFEELFRTAYNTGLLRFDFAPLIQLSMVLQVCMTFLTFIPLYRIALPSGEDLFSPAASKPARMYIIDFVVHAMMIDFPEQIEWIAEGE